MLTYQLNPLSNPFQPLVLLAKIQKVRQIIFKKKLKAFGHLINFIPFFIFLYYVIYIQ